MNKSTIYIIREEKDKPSINYGFNHVKSGKVFWKSYKNINLHYWILSLCINERRIAYFLNSNFDNINVLLTKQDIESLKKDIEDDSIYSYNLDSELTKKQEIDNTLTFCNSALLEYDKSGDVCFYYNSGY